jgi:hypothetical protein
MIQVHDTPKRTRPWDDRFQPAGSLIVMKLETLLFYWKSLLDRLSKTGRVPSIALQGLIRDVEESSGYSRNDARAKAKAWLLSHVSSMNQTDIAFAREHFAYLLPVGWGHR